MGLVQDIVLFFCVWWGSYPQSEGRGEKGQCDLVCVERLSMIGLVVAITLMSY